jgi:hypothetical protein
VTNGKRKISIKTPTALWLTLGGDHRLLLNSSSGLNQYYCSPFPTPEVSSWGSCTASSPGERAYSAAIRLQQWFAEESEDEPDRSFKVANDIRSDILRWADLDEKIDVVLTPSATDAEFIPLWLCLARGDKVLNIVVGPTETGSGSRFAAAGLHISSITPSGTTVLMSAPLEQMRNLPVRTEEFDIRESGGSLIDRTKLEDSIAKSIVDAVQKGEIVLLHHLDCSKTGARLPSRAFCSEMQDKHGEQVRVVVDAAQLRTDPVKIRSWLDRGWAVLISGSKFYAGPPFCGAVLLPKKGWGAAAHIASPPVGFRDYFSAQNFPSDWLLWRKRLSKKANIGMLLRWAGALAEMHSYAALSREMRSLALDQMAQIMQDSIEACMYVKRVEPHREIENDKDSLVEGICTRATVETFSVHLPNQANEDSLLTLYECRKLHRMLRDDIAKDFGTGLDNSKLQVLSRPFALGQAVSLGSPNNGALRLAASAPMITGLCEGSLSLESLRSDLEALFSKLSLCLELFSDELRPGGDL